MQNKLAGGRINTVHCGLNKLKGGTMMTRVVWRVREEKRGDERWKKGVFPVARIS